MPPNHVQIRPACIDDDDAIAEIWNAEVKNGLATYQSIPRSPAEQRSWRTERAPHHPVAVAVIDDQVAGFGAIGPYRDTEPYRFTCDIGIYVRERRRRTGVGRQLLRSLEAAANANGMHVIVARISAGNVGSTNLFEAEGYERIGIEREVAFKHDVWRDVLLFQKILTSIGDGGS